MSKISELARGASMAADAWLKLEKWVEVYKGTPQAMHLLVTNENLLNCLGWTIAEYEYRLRTAMNITVQYDKSFAHMLSAAKFSEVDPRITSQNFPIAGIGVAKRRISFIGFNYYTSVDVVTHCLTAMDLEPARIEDLFAMGTRHPDLNRNESIYFLGSRSRDNLVPSLENTGQVRKLTVKEFPDTSMWAGPRYAAVARRKT